jgi:general secretion pathway protein I
MPRRLRSRPCIGGFTLLEVLVAFVILLLAFAVLMRIFATGSRGLVATDDVNLAVAFAQADLAMVGVTEPLEAGERNGELAQGYRWERAIAPFPTREEELSANVPSLYQVTTRISWERNGRPRELSLTTLRIGPMPNLAGAGN